MPYEDHNSARMFYPLNEAKDKQQGYIKFTVQERQDNDNGVVNWRPGAVTRLYIPNGLQVSDGVGYSNADLGVIGAMAAASVQKGPGSAAASAVQAIRGDELDTVKNMLTRVLGNMIPEITGSALAATVGSGALMGAGLGSLVDTSTIANGISYGSQKSFNPNTVAIFERVNIRNFTLVFSMVPTSKEEAEMIRKIVKHFRTELYPEAGGSLADYPIFLNYPNRFNIEVRPLGDQSSEYDLKFLPAHLANVSVGYNGTATSWHEDGAPVETTISLSFVESQALSKEDVMERNL